jgi:hemerythrin-like domain-containing protein
MRQKAEAYLRGLREDHARFSRVMSMIGRDARRLADEPEAVLPLFSEAVDYVVSFQNVYHHPREEIMFAKIAEKSETLAETAATLSGEHNSTAHAGEELLSIMGRISPAPSDRPDRERLARRLEKFAEAMRGHIAQEEELLYSQVWAELAPEDWDGLVESAAAIDPLGGNQENNYPLLTRYVSEGQTQSSVAIDGGPLAQFLESGLNQAAAFSDQIGLINKTLTQQRREACALSRKSLRAMPIIPMLQPERSLRAGSESAAELGRTYMRWLREWGEVFRSEKEDV